MSHSHGRVRAGRILIIFTGLLLAFLLVGVPVGGSLLLTHARFADPTPQRAPSLQAEDVEFLTDDGVRLSGWWSSEFAESRGTIVFLHGLNNSRQEMADRAAEMRTRGFSTLLFDLRNHGSSSRALTTLGIRERLDACSAARFARSRAMDDPVILWGVSLGASSALLGAVCADATAVISDSSFLSFEETVKHHFREIFHLPAFPVADLLILATRLRLGIELSEGDVELAVRRMPQIPVLFIAGGEDWRMPPELARILYRASGNAKSRLVVIDGAAHGRAFRRNPDLYLDTVETFLEDVLPDAR